MKNLATTYEKSGKKEEAAAMEEYAGKAIKNSLDMESRNNLRSMLGGGDVVRPQKNTSGGSFEGRGSQSMGGGGSKAGCTSSTHDNFRINVQFWIKIYKVIDETVQKATTHIKRQLISSVST